MVGFLFISLSIKYLRRSHRKFRYSCNRRVKAHQPGEALRRSIIKFSSVLILLFLPPLLTAQELQPPREEGTFRPPDLVELVKIDKKLRLDIRYATPDNFTGRAVYTEARAFLHRK